MIWRAVTDGDGRILRTMGATEAGEAQASADLAVTSIGEGAVARHAPGMMNPSLHWWSGAEFSPRPQLPALPSTIATGATVTVDELPNGASVRIEDDERFTVGQGVVADHAIPMVFRYPGTFSIHIGEGDTAFPYLPRSYTVTVVDP